MTRREEILRLITLKRQAIKLLTEVAEEQVKRQRADITSLQLELREIDYAENAHTAAA